MTNRFYSDRHPTSIEHECPNCGGREITTTREVERFKFGKGADAVELAATIPVRRCVSCGFEYTDSEAEDAHHEAVCRHLGVLTPREIVSLRKRYGLSRSEFAETTRIGEASLHRWETGQLVQNPGYDQLLYLLRYPTNMDRLKERSQGKLEKHAVQQVDLSTKFPNVVNITEVRGHAEAFRLRPTA